MLDDVGMKQNYNDDVLALTSAAFLQMRQLEEQIEEEYREKNEAVKV